MQLRKSKEIKRNNRLITILPNKNKIVITKGKCIIPITNKSFLVNKKQSNI